MVMKIYAENKCGVLTRITGMFMKKSYNIISLTAVEDTDPEYAIITVVFDGDEYAETQLPNQITKLFNVKWAKLCESDNQ